MLLLLSMTDRGAGHRGLLRARREKGAATQQLRQQQQQPATRHRSTARRLVSTSSRRADTSDSLPNDMAAQANSGSSADTQVSGLGHPATRYRWRPSASKMNVVGSDSTESRCAPPDWRPCRSRRGRPAGRSAQTWSTTRRTAAHGPAPVRAEVQDGRPGAGQAQVGRVDVGGGLRVAAACPDRSVSSRPMT